MSTDSPSSLQALERAYMALLELPHNSVRLSQQTTLCSLRDAIASYTGQSNEYVQNKYEALVLSLRSEIGAQTNSPAKRPGNPRVPPESCQEGAEGGCDDKSHTPRTDAHTKSWSSILNDDLRGSWVEADFARQLERELTGAYELLHRTEDEKMALRSATGAIELLRKVLAAHERLHASGTHGLPLSLKNEIAAAIAATDSRSD